MEKIVQHFLSVGMDERSALILAYRMLGSKAPQGYEDEKIRGQFNEEYLAHTMRVDERRLAEQSTQQAAQRSAAALFAAQQAQPQVATSPEDADMAVYRKYAHSNSRSMAPAPDSSHSNSRSRY